MSDGPGAPPPWAGPWPPGWTVRYVAETGSTNRDLVAGAGVLPDHTALVADHQTAGRGRLDRRWDAPPATNLLVSLLLHPAGADPAELPRRVALAAVDACTEMWRESGVDVDDDVRVKWPNDLQLDGRKLAGLLAERHVSGAVVVGLGINVGWCPDGAARLGDQVSRPALLARVLAAYDVLPESPAALMARYRSSSATIGRRVRVELPGDDLTGTVTDLTDDGQLVVLDESGSRHQIAVGDVIHLHH
ncbi:biotin--[acetyl-CoA-carboxylase] ligase [soil metagenome]